MTKWEILIGDYPLQLPAKFNPLPSIKVGDIGGITSRNTMYAPTLTVPTTPQNLQAFGLIASGISLTPLAQLNTRLLMLADGFDVLGGGGGYRLKGVTYGAGGKISFDVLALGANFYEALRALRISDLDLSLGDAFWTPDINTSYVAAYLANPFADFGANAPASGVINKQYPFYPLHWIL
jgi:hypothetical protein